MLNHHRRSPRVQTLYYVVANRASHVR
jgi:hypothetical protein